MNFLRLALAVAVLSIHPPFPADAGELALDDRQTRVFATICARCHVRPGIGAPVVGDEAEWAQRRAKGADVLLANTIVGFRDMPPLGTCSFCDEDDLRRLVALLAGLPSPPQAALPNDEASKP